MSGPKDQSTAHDAQPSQEHVHEKTPDSPYPAPQVKMPSTPQESPNYPQTTQHTPSQESKNAKSTLLYHSHEKNTGKPKQGTTEA